MQRYTLKMLIMGTCAFGLMACDTKTQKNTEAEQVDRVVKVENPDVLPFLNIQQAKAKYALPFCEKKNCIEIDIQTIQTQDAWMNQWIGGSLSQVIQDQIGLKQAMTLQQAVDAYVKHSDQWQQEFIKNKAYELHLTTRIAAQRNQYVLLQVIVNSKQAEITVKDRGYFLVADRQAQKKLSLLDILQPEQQNAMNALVQTQYAAWLKQQTAEVKKIAPKKLYWGQNDWFFDGEGIGIHYRASEIVKDGTQLDLYLSKAQTQMMLKPEIFQKMF